jgi:hypothetical protein
VAKNIFGKIHVLHVGFQVIAAVTMNSTVFKVVTPCSLEISEENFASIFMIEE